jgi:hypothetical protein
LRLGGDRRSAVVVPRPIALLRGRTALGVGPLAGGPLFGIFAVAFGPLLGEGGRAVGEAFGLMALAVGFPFCLVLRTFREAFRVASEVLVLYL